MEIDVVDGGSTGGSRELLRSLDGVTPDLIVLYHLDNRGKGAAGGSRLGASTGDIVILMTTMSNMIRKDYHALIAPMQHYRVQMVSGSRNLRANYYP